MHFHRPYHLNGHLTIQPKRLTCHKMATNKNRKRYRDCLIHQSRFVSLIIFYIFVVVISFILLVKIVVINGFMDDACRIFTEHFAQWFTGEFGECVRGRFDFKIYLISVTWDYGLISVALELVLELWMRTKENPNIRSINLSTPSEKKTNV